MCVGLDLHSVMSANTMDTALIKINCCCRSLIFHGQLSQGYSVRVIWHGKRLLLHPHLYGTQSNDVAL